jgi:hypothetical protein
MTTDTQDDIWIRLLSPAGGAMTPEAARFVLQLEFSPADHARMAALNEGANEGLLTADERDELDKYVRVGHQLSLLKSHAWSALKRTAL